MCVVFSDRCWVVHITFVHTVKFECIIIIIIIITIISYNNDAFQL